MMVAVAALLLWAFLWPREHETSYEGRTLSEWLIVYTDNRPLRDQAANAVHHIGTNALPLLVKWMSYKMPKWRKTVAGAVALNATSPARRRFLRSVAGLDALRAEVAVAGFEILGPEAAPAVPALTNLLGDWDWRSRANFERATIALKYMGNAGLTPLVCFVTNRNAPTEYRWAAASRIEAPITGWDTHANWAVPVLIGCLDDRAVAPQIVRILGDLRLEPALAVPALARCLEHDYTLISIKAAESLGRFGMSASVAVPDLVKALGSRDKFVRYAASNALEIIAPEVLKKAAHLPPHNTIDGVPGARRHQ